MKFIKTWLGGITGAQSQTERGKDFREKFDYFMICQMQIFEKTYGSTHDCIVEDNEKSWVAAYIFTDTISSAFVNNSPFELEQIDKSKLKNTLKWRGLTQLCHCFPLMKESIPDSAVNHTDYVLSNLVDKLATSGDPAAEKMYTARDLLLADVSEPIKKLIVHDSLDLTLIMLLSGRLSGFFNETIIGDKNG